jgi:hypothetical protein
MVCVNIQVRSASWDVPINTTPSFTTHRLYTSKINHHRQTYIHIYTRCDFFVFLFFVLFRNTYHHIHVFIHWCRSFISTIYRMYRSTDEKNEQYFVFSSNHHWNFSIFFYFFRFLKHNCTFIYRPDSTNLYYTSITQIYFSNSITCISYF